MAEDLSATAGVGRAAFKTSAPGAGPPGFTLFDEIGHGGMGVGVVYGAGDEALGRDSAVKLLADRYPAASPAAWANSGKSGRGLAGLPGEALGVECTSDVVTTPNLVSLWPRPARWRGPATPSF